MAAMGGGPRARVAAGRTRWQRPAHAASGPGPGRRAQSPFGQFGQFAGPRTAPRCRERSGSGGNIFAPCMISGPSTRKGGLDGKIRAPCIPNRPIAPGNGRIRRGSCHFDLEKHAFRADIAREGAFFAHSAKKGCIRRDSCQPGPRCRRNARDGDTGDVAAGAMRMGLSKRGRRNGAETEGHTGAWAQWSRAAQCRRCNEGQDSAEIAGRRGKRMDTVQERGARWTRGSAGV